MSLPRIAFCTDTFDEPNGVATISRQFADFARAHDYPMLLVRPGSRTRAYSDGPLRIIDVSKSALSLPLDMGVRFDLRISRHFPWLREQFAAFEPDIVHITGPGDIGMVSARIAHVLRPKVPLVASWHTNVHQYARMRLRPILRMLPRKAGAALGQKTEQEALRAAARFYKCAKLILAPNDEILGELTRRTGKPGRRMPHGVDTALFAPPRVAPRGGPITLGYVGRLTPEKNVRFLAAIAAGLPNEVRKNVRFLIVGDGSERPWLERHLPGARFTGILRNQELAEAYAEMDVFLFPSLSDTFGLVVLEAMSTGVPVVSFQLAGPRSAVDNGRTGYTAHTPEEFEARVLDLIRDAGLRSQFQRASRAAALLFSWESVFQSIYAAYETVLPVAALASR